MTIVASGTISINSLVGEYGGSAPHAMNEYYRGGSLVADHSNNSNVPTSGTIDLQDFYGANNTSPIDYSVGFTAGTVTTSGKITQTYNGVNATTDSSGSTFGSFSDNSITTAEGAFTVTGLYSVHMTGVYLTAYITLLGNHGGGSFESVVGTGYDKWKIGTTTYITDGGNAGAYQSSYNHTRYTCTQTTTMPASGSQTMILST